MCDWSGTVVTYELAMLGEVGRVCAGVHGEEVVVDECFRFGGAWG